MADDLEPLRSVPTSVVLDYAEKIAREHNVDPDFAKSIILSENMGAGDRIPSTLRTDRTSPKKAYGISQVMPDTYTGLKNQGYLKPDHSLNTWQGQVEAGIAAIRAKMKEQNTRDPIVLAAAYNAGNHGARLAAAGNLNQLPAETQEYLKKLRLAHNYVTGMRGTQVASVSSVPDPGTLPDDRRATVDISSRKVISTPTPEEDLDPGQKALLALTKTVELNRTEIERLIKETSGSLEEATGKKQQAADALLLAGSLEGSAAQVTGVIEASTAAGRQAALRIANMDHTKANSRFATLLAERLELQRARAPIAAEVDERMSVGFFDDPLSWLGNQMVLPGIIAQHNALARRESDNIQQMETLQKEIDAQQKLGAGTTADDFLKRGLLLAKAAEAKATAEAATARSNASALNAQRLLNLASLRETITRDQERLYQWRVMGEERAAKAKTKAEQDEADAEIDRSSRLIGDFIGAPYASLQWLKKQDKKTKDDWEKPVATRRIGTEFPDSLRFVRTYGNLENMRNRGAGELADHLRSWYAQVDTKARNIQNTWGQTPETAMVATRRPNWEQAQEMAAEILTNEWVGQRDNDMMNSAAYNPYRADHQKTARAWTGNPRNPVYLLAKDAHKRGQKIDDRILFDAMTKLVNDGVIKPRDAAAAFSEYYSFVVDTNNRDRSLQQLGLEKQDSYTVRPRGFKNTIDLTNPVVTENLVTKAYIGATGGGFATVEGDVMGFGVPERTKTGKQISEELAEEAKKK